MLEDVEQGGLKGLELRGDGVMNSLTSATLSLPFPYQKVCGAVDQVGFRALNSTRCLSSKLDDP